MDADQLDEPTRRAVEQMLCSGSKIAAIKQIRTATGLALKDSKELAEAIEHRLRNEGRIKAQTGSGCLGLLLALAALPTAVFVFA